MTDRAAARDAVEQARDWGQGPLLSLATGVEELLEALADRAGDPLDRHARVTEAIVALGEMGVRLPQAMVDRLRAETY